MLDTQINRRIPGVVKTFRPCQRVEVVSDYAVLPRGTMGSVEYPVGKNHLVVWIRTDRGGLALLRNEDIDEVRE